MTFERYDTRILKVQLYIEEHLDEELRLESLAELANTSPYHFHRIFKGVCGETLAGYIRRMRLEQSSMQLKYSDRPIVEIAFDAGYQTHEAYTRAFNKRYGISPSQFREGVIPKTNYQKEMTKMSTTTYEVKIVDIDPIPVAARRHVGPYESVGPFFGEFLGWAGQSGLLGPETKVLGLCHDDPSVTEPSKIRFDCCISVPESFEARDDVTKQEVDGGRYAVLRHKGPYTELAGTYDWFFSVWLTSSKEQLRDLPPFEIYVSDVMTTPPEDLLTDIYLPLQ